MNRPTPFPCCQKLLLNQIRPVQEEHKVKFNRFSLWNSFPSHKKRGVWGGGGESFCCKAICNLPIQKFCRTTAPPFRQSPCWSLTCIVVKLYIPPLGGQQMLPGHRSHQGLPLRWSWFQMPQSCGESIVNSSHGSQV